MTIVLEDRQIELAREFAMRRHEAKHISFRNKSRLVERNKPKTLVEEYVYHRTHKAHFLGLLGEIAYATAVGAKIDTNIYSVRDTGADVNGAEVKTSTFLGNEVELKIPQTEFDIKSPKKYILARLNENRFHEVELVGEISREDFAKYKTTKQYGPNNPINYIVGICHLKPIQPMSKTIEQLNDDLSHTESTLAEVVESCEDWLNSMIQEPSADFIKGIQQFIIKRHPNVGRVIEDPEF